MPTAEEEQTTIVGYVIMGVKVRPLLDSPVGDWHDVSQTWTLCLSFIRSFIHSLILVSHFLYVSNLLPYQWAASLGVFPTNRFGPCAHVGI